MYFPRWSYDLLERAFAPRRTPLEAPGTGIFDDPTLCVQVNTAWYAHILGVLEVLAAPDAWDGDEAQIFAAQQQIETLLNAIDTQPCEEPGEEPGMQPVFVAQRVISGHIASVAGENHLTGWTVYKADDRVSLVSDTFSISPRNPAYLILRHSAWNVQFSQLAMRWQSHTFSGNLYGIQQRITNNGILEARGDVVGVNHGVAVTPVMLASAASSLGLGYYMAANEQNLVSEFEVWM